MEKKVVAALTGAIGLVIGGVAGAYLGATSATKGPTTDSELRGDASSSPSSKPPSVVEEGPSEPLVLHLQAQVRTLQEAQVASANIRLKTRNGELERHREKHAKVEAELKSLQAKAEAIPKLEAALDAAEQETRKLQAQLQSEGEANGNKVEELRKAFVQKTEEYDAERAKHVLTQEQLQSSSADLAKSQARVSDL
ncbi:unnamed protein product [Sphagnum balticum]